MAISTVGTLGTLAFYSAIAGTAARFRGLLARAREVQQQQLLEILQYNADTEYGRRYGFSNIIAYTQFREQVPVSDYETLRASIERMAAGAANVLVPGVPLAFEETGGSTGGPKLLPYTPQLLASFRNALLPWLDDLAGAYPQITEGLAYWAISPAARRARKTSGGIPIGLGGDAAYFGETLAPLVLETLAVPPSVTAITDIDAWREATCTYLNECERLALISVWSPAFLADLLSHLGANCARLWPQLQVVSCWDQAASRPYAAALRATLGGIPVQGKGLLATEGVVSVPLHGMIMPVLALESGFFEFRDMAGICHDLVGVSKGCDYDVLMTTWGGLYRYAIGDRVHVHGFEGEAPLLEFLGRGGVTSDLCGEKLSEDFVIRALRPLGLCFALLAPASDGRRGYLLFVDAADLPAAAAAQTAARADTALCTNPQYAYARKLGQLAALEIRRCVRPLETWQRKCVARGLRLGDIKPPALSSDDGWAQRLQMTVP
jgi:hypothetical protein